MLKTAAVAIISLNVGSLSFAGDLTPPPGPVAPTMKSLDIVEPRTPIGPDTTPGDSDSLYIITEPGSYYLTGDIVVSDKQQDGIRVDVQGATIDLMGFNVRNVAAGSSSDGIASTVASMGARTVVRNGGVTGWDTGVRVRDYSIIKGVRAVDCTLGLVTGSGCIIQDCIVENSSVRGIATATGCRVASTTVTSSGTSSGVQMGPATLVDDCTSSFNGFCGFQTFPSVYSLLSDCTARGNASDGIDLNRGIAVRCFSTENQRDGFVNESSTAAIIRECSATANAESGIVTDNGSLIAQCVLNRNGFDAIVVADGCSIYDNTLAGNLSAITAGDGCFIARNSSTDHEFGTGVNAFEYARIVDNLCNKNAFGIDASTGSTIEHNTVAQNFTGVQVQGFGSRISHNNTEGNTAEGIVVTGRENLIERNRFSNNLTEGLLVIDERNLILRNINRFSVGAWNIAPSNRVASIAIPPASGVISGDSDPDALGAGTTGFWSNFSH